MGSGCELPISGFWASGLLVLSVRGGGVYQRDCWGFVAPSPPRISSSTSELQSDLGGCSGSVNLDSFKAELAEPFKARRAAKPRPPSLTA